MRSRIAPLLAATFVLGACAHAPAQTSATQSSVKEERVMTTPAAPGAAGQDVAPHHPKLTAEQALTRLLELLRTSRTVKDFAPETLVEAFGVEFAREGNRHVFSEQVNQEWAHSLEITQASDGSTSEVHYRIDQVDPSKHSRMTGICRPDFARFAAELETMEFVSTPHDAKYEPGVVLGYDFLRPDMLVSVGTHAESGDPNGRAGHECISTVTIS